jgi:hypothetical protein
MLAYQVGVIFGIRKITMFAENAFGITMTDGESISVRLEVAQWNSS